VAEDAHPDLVPTIERIGIEWRARDVADFWEDYGNESVTLSEAEQAVIGAVLCDHTELTVPVSSGTLIARAVEHLRTVEGTSVPLRLAKGLLETSPVVAVEMLACVMCLSGGMADDEVGDYVRLMVDAAVRAEEAVTTPTDSERLARVMGLVTLVFSVLGAACKLAALDDAIQTIKDRPLHAGGVRVAMIALFTDSDEARLVQDAFRRKCEGGGKGREYASVYNALRPTRGTARESWNALVQAFGRSHHHSQASEYGKFRAEYLAFHTEVVALRGLSTISSLLGQCDPYFVTDCIGIDIAQILKGIADIDCNVRQGTMSEVQVIQRVQGILDDPAHRVHCALVRIGAPASRLVCVAFYQVIASSMLSNNLELSRDVCLPLSAMELKWPSGTADYLPLFGHVYRIFDEIFSNVASKATESSAPTDLWQFSDACGTARAWIAFDLNREPPGHGISIVIANGVTNERPYVEFVPKLTGYREVGIDVTSEESTSGGQHYYLVRVRIPTLASMLEAS
jgi:hypothetical protein